MQKNGEECFNNGENPLKCHKISKKYPNTPQNIINYENNVLKYLTLFVTIIQSTIISAHSAAKILLMGWLAIL